MLQHLLHARRFAFARRALWCVVCFLGLLHCLMQLGIWLPGHALREDSKRDVPVYFKAARAAKSGRPLYRPYVNYGPEQVPNRFFYPPPFAAALSLGLGWNSSADAAAARNFSRLWYGLLLVAFWLYAWTLARLAGGRGPWPVLVAGLALELWPGANIAMSYGNAEPVMWALLGGSLALASGAARGAALALASLIKVYPLLPLVVAARREARPYALGALATLVAGAALGVAVCGLEAFAAWRAAAGPVAAQGTFLGNNVSLSFAVLRLANLAGWHYPGGPLPLPARLFLMACALTAPFAALWCTRKSEVKWQVAITLSATVLFAPLCWDMYLPILLLPAALWLKRLRNGSDPAP